MKYLTHITISFLTLTTYLLSSSLTYAYEETDVDYILGSDYVPAAGTVAVFDNISDDDNDAIISNEIKLDNTQLNEDYEYVEIDYTLGSDYVPAGDLVAFIDDETIVVSDNITSSNYDNLLDNSRNNSLNNYVYIDIDYTLGSDYEPADEQLVNNENEAEDDAEISQINANSNLTSLLSVYH